MTDQFNARSRTPFVAAVCILITPHEVKNLYQHAFRKALHTQTPAFVLRAYDELKRMGLTVRRTEYFSYEKERVFRRILHWHCHPPSSLACVDHGCAGDGKESDCAIRSKRAREVPSLPEANIDEKRLRQEQGIGNSREWFPSFHTWAKVIRGPSTINEITKRTTESGDHLPSQAETIAILKRSDIPPRQTSQALSTNTAMQGGDDRKSLQPATIDYAAVPFFECYSSDHASPHFYSRNCVRKPKANVTFHGVDDEFPSLDESIDFQRREGGCDRVFCVHDGATLDYFSVKPFNLS
mmetsp:Transcript_29096/g.74734  ORF Transcript_29096/g.74734 Transcript_29096/m.74734 type:complete len:296 (-) Transcript_29096:436-1323(-)